MENKSIKWSIIAAAILLGGIFIQANGQEDYKISKFFGKGPVDD